MPRADHVPTQQAGEYLVEYYVEPQYAVHQATRYRLRHDGLEQDVIVHEIFPRFVAAEARLAGGLLSLNGRAGQPAVLVPPGSQRFFWKGPVRVDVERIGLGGPGTRAVGVEGDDRVKPWVVLFDTGQEKLQRVDCTATAGADIVRQRKCAFIER